MTYRLFDYAYITEGNVTLKRIIEFSRLSAIRFFFFLSILGPFLLFASSCSRQTEERPKVSNGILDLRNWDFQRHPLLDLTGDWEYYPDRLASDGNAEEKKSLFAVPGVWLGSGYATMKLGILLPKNAPNLAFYSKGQATAFDLYVNGAKVLKSGIVGKDPVSSVPESRGSFGEWDPSGVSIAQVTLDISNFHHRFGGLWYGIRFGESSALREEVARFRDMDWFLGGIFFLTFLYHVGLFLIRRQDLSPLPFGLFCFTLFVRILVTEDKILLSYFPSFGYLTSMRLEYLTFYLSLPLGLHYLRSIYPDLFPRIWMGSFYGLGLIFSVGAFLPFPEASKAIPYYQASMFASIILVVYVLVLAVWKRKPYAIPLMVGYLILSTAGVIEVLAAHQILKTRSFLPLGLFVLVMIETFVLSFRYGDLYREKEALAEELRRINSTYSSFVPSKFLGLLDKQSVAELKPGDQVRREVTILFSDIRSFTEISESMNAKENFEFLNTYLGRMEPVIRTNRGFVEKYFGDGIMALFSETPDDAVLAAIQMQKEILIYNRQRLAEGRRPFQVGIGIHTGSSILGLIGAEGRMDSTVISEAVHVAARLEVLTKFYGTGILLSQDTYSSLKNRERFLSRKLDRIPIKGKKEEVFIYEIGDYLSDAEQEAFRNSKTGFEKGVDAFLSGRFMDAGETFREALRVYPGDKTSLLYLKRCTEQMPVVGGRLPDSDPI
ncbi:adenylate/guanylate cyclase domain-containing protein [Leptospira fluminis]|uniref:adenylate/guanylate cyclase domain-containing protein n=1 Tax=Leptospira fluminis TaxID=2484979 RepID=UPI001FEC5852|nr:adenylate/guanylate cyclase domain-containing protein [Leptospira fluminis]